MNEVQTLIDSLAAHLQRPVGVDDRRFRSLAYSAHADEIDPVRRTSILGRHAPAAVTEWLEQLGVLRVQEPLHVPANAELGMVARLCVPVRFHGRLLGLLWLVELEGPLDEDELEACRRCAGDLAQELYRLHQQEDHERQAEAETVERLLRPRASGEETQGARVAVEPVYAVFEIRVEFSSDHAIAAGVDVRLTEAVDRLRRSVPPRHQLAAVGETRATIVMAAATSDELDRRAATLLDALQSELEDVAGAQVLVGAGEPVKALAGLSESHNHARLAARMGASMPGLGPLVRWDDLGVLRLVSELLGDRESDALLPPPLRRLLADPDGQLLVTTLEAYLDHAGDAAAAAAEIFVHRSSLYHRLHRIEEVAGIDIRSGADRLELHLGLCLWRMGGGGKAVG